MNIDGKPITGSKIDQKTTHALCRYRDVGRKKSPTSPLAQVWVPWPCRKSSTKSPSYVEPSGQVCLPGKDRQVKCCINWIPMTDQAMIGGKIQGFFIWKIMLKMANTNFWQIHPGTNELNSSTTNEYVAMLQQHLSKQTTSSSSLKG